MSTTFNEDVLIDAADLEVLGGNIEVNGDETNLGPESYSQTTFTPSHSNWTAEEDFSFVGNVPTYSASTGWGDLYQDAGDLAEPMVTSLYRFQWTLQNVTPGNLVCQLWGSGMLATIALANGTTTVDFYFPGGDPPYVYCEGTTGGFEVVSVSLKQIPGGSVVAEGSVLGSMGLFSDNVGVGVAVPLQPLHVGGFGGFNKGIVIGTDYVALAQQALRLFREFTESAYSSIYGAEITVKNTSGATITNAYGVYANVPNTSGAGSAITNSWGVYVHDNGGTLTNKYARQWFRKDPADGEVSERLRTADRHRAMKRDSCRSGSLR